MSQKYILPLMELIEKIKLLLFGGSQRTAKLKKNVTGSALLRCIGILISLVLVPLTINYINPTQYGIWLTLSTIVGWVGYFNIGINNGFKNRFAESVAKGDQVLARQYVSTTYVLMAMIFIPVGLILVSINQFVNWPSLLKIDHGYLIELRRTFDVLIVCFCSSMIIKIVNIMLEADQKYFLSSLIGAIGRTIMLGVIYIMTLSTKGTLLGLAFANAGIPLLVTVVASFIVFSKKRYKNFAPQFSYIRLSLTKNIIVLGAQFFLINISNLFIFQMINVVISRTLGPDVVTQYGIALRYFFVLNQFFMMIVIPIWPAFTDAYTQGDLGWMKRTVNKMEKIYLLFLIIVCVMFLIAPVAYNLWVGDSVTIPFEVSLMTMLYLIAKISGDMYNFMLNGIGKVRLQTIIYIVFAAIAVPGMSYLGEYLGIIGILLLPILTMFTLSLVGRIQVRMIISKKSAGIWDR